MTSLTTTCLLSTLLAMVVACCLIQTAVQDPVQPQKLTKDNLKFMRTYANSQYDFIILDNEFLTIDGHVDTQYLPVGNNIKYKYTDCSDNLLEACKAHRNVPILLVYNRVVIEYEEGWVDKFSNMNILKQNPEYQQKVRENAGKWAHKVCQSQVHKNIETKQKVLQFVEAYQSVYIMVQNSTLGENEQAYQILARQFPNQHFIYYDNYQMAENIGFNISEGSFIHLNKNLSIQQFPKVDRPRYQMWKRFVSSELFSNIKQLNPEITSSRFDPDKLPQLKQTIIFCDQGVRCMGFMEQLNRDVLENSQEFANITHSIINFDNSKNAKIVELYLHLKLTKKMMPLLVVVQGVDPRYKHVPARYVRQLSLESSGLSQIRQAWSDIESGAIQSQFLSSGTPKKNGFYGKGSEKNVQKVSFETYKPAIMAANKQSANYILFINTFDFQCSQCAEMYAELKKLAAYLKAEDRQDIKFGVLDLSNNQIDMPQLQSIPVILLFKPGSIREEDKQINSENVVTYHSSPSFDYMLRFINLHRKEQNSEL